MKNPCHLCHHDRAPDIGSMFICRSEKAVFLGYGGKRHAGMEKFVDDCPFFMDYYDARFVGGGWEQKTPGDVPGIERAKEGQTF